MNPYRYLRQLPDPDGTEVDEWVDSVDDLARVSGLSRSRQLLLHVLRRAADVGVDLPAPRMTDYLATYASATTLYEVGFNHFFHGKSDGGFSDQLFIQGHASPGIYARAFHEGRLARNRPT